jgi:hypothetical protein
MMLFTKETRPMSIEIEPIPASKEPVSFKPKTPLGRKLWELRQKIVASGEPLLDWEELEKEVAERRGDHYEKP